MAEFQWSTELNVRPEIAYDFLTTPRNLIHLSPPEVQFRLIEAPTEIVVGVQFEFEVTAMGMTQQSIHEIIEVESPTRFVEQQVKGPLKSWLHEHRFEQLDDASVRVDDLIEFQPPGGLAGFVMNERRIREGLEQLFAFRAETLRQMLESDA